MRIRKNAKISKLFYKNTNVSNDVDECLIQKLNLCQLNQSPWDIITFPSADDSSSSLHQFDDYEVYYNVNHIHNASSIDSVREFERKITVDDNVASLTTFEGENDNLFDPKNNDRKEILGFDDEEANEVREEMLLCDHHIVEFQNHEVWSTKKKSGPVAGTRARKTKKRASTEFYYYSGFGPSWGKKRGTGSTYSNTYNEPVKVAFASDDTKIKEAGSIINVAGPTINDTGIRKEEWGRLVPETYEIHPEITEIACVNDKEDKKKGKTGKKRGRKPMKARSLKSLM